MKAVRSALVICLILAACSSPVVPPRDTSPSATPEPRGPETTKPRENVAPPQAQPDTAADDLAASEAVLRYEWAKRTEEENDGLMGFYLALAGDDFPEVFYKRFEGNVPTVYRVSELPIPVEDVRTSLWTAYFLWSFGHSQRIGSNAIRVRGGYQCGKFCKSVCDYTVVQSGRGVWSVDKVERCEAARGKSK